MDKDTSDVKQTISYGSQRAPQQQETPSTRRGLWRIMCILGVVLTLAAWGVFFFAAGAAAVIAVLGVVCSALGVKVGKGCLRDIAITCIIASAVLVAVFCLFNWGVPYAIDNI